jgi:hypothetical protein
MWAIAALLVAICIEQVWLWLRGPARNQRRKPRPVPSPELSLPDAYDARLRVTLAHWPCGQRWPTVQQFSPQAHATENATR